MRENRNTGSVQYSAVNESHCGQASMIGHKGKEVTSSVQYSAINECDCGKASMTVMRENRVQVQCSAVL